MKGKRSLLPVLPTMDTFISKGTHGAGIFLPLETRPPISVQALIASGEARRDRTSPGWRAEIEELQDLTNDWHEEILRDERRRTAVRLCNEECGPANDRYQ